MTWGVLAWTAWAALLVWLIICIIFTAATEPVTARHRTIIFVAMLWGVLAAGFVATVYITATAALT